MVPRKCAKGEKKESLSEAMKTTGTQKAKVNILDITTKKHKDVEMKEHAQGAAKTQKNLLEILTSH